MKRFDGTCPKCGGDRFTYDLAFHVDNVTAVIECEMCELQFDVIYDDAKIIDEGEEES